MMLLNKIDRCNITSHCAIIRFYILPCPSTSMRTEQRLFPVLTSFSQSFCPFSEFHILITMSVVRKWKSGWSAMSYTLTSSSTPITWIKQRLILDYKHEEVCAAHILRHNTTCYVIWSCYSNLHIHPPLPHLTYPSVSHTLGHTNTKTWSILTVFKTQF